MLLYINQRFSSRTIIASHKNLKLLKWASSSSEWYDEVNMFSAILECENVFICVIWNHKTKKKSAIWCISTFQWYHLTQRSTLRISILRILIKVRKNFLPDKKARPDLTLPAIDLKFAQIVVFYKSYNLYKF